MFWKSKPNITSGFIHISLNIGGIREWLKNRGEVGVDGEWKSFYPIVVHSIDYLVKEDVYFHRNANQFSNGVTGSHYIDDDIKTIEWEFVHGELLFHLTHYENAVIAHFPLDEIGILLTKGKRKPRNLRRNMSNESEVITREGANENCRQIRKRLWMDYSVMYFNDLVSLDFGIDPQYTSVEYPSGIENSTSN
tara:strand:+ start:227 stop:805 length:579 start_codon:yes stop_codon:yes gene_type:complete